MEGLPPNRKWSWNPSNHNIFVQFCKETSLAGLKYVGERDRHILERIFWLIAFICGIIMAGILIENVWHKAGTNPIFVAFGTEDIQIGRIPFPATTICNVNRVRKSVVLEIQKNATDSDEQIKLRAEEELELIKSICSAKPSLIQKLRKSVSKRTQIVDGQKHLVNSTGVNIIDLLYKVSQPCGEMLKRCFIGPIEISCEQEFLPIVTEAGLCCTANMLTPPLLLNYPQMFEPTIEFRKDEVLESMENMTKLWRSWDFKKGFVIKMPPDIIVRPRRQFKQGKSFGMSILLFPDLDDYYCTSGDHLGFKLVVHPPLELPHPFEYGLAVPVNSEVYENVIPQLVISNDDISKVNISYRRCYFPNEFPLKYFKAYTDSNCIDECSSNYSLQDCGCVQYYHPRDNSARLCGESDLKCTKMLAENAAGGKTRCSHCYPLCNEIDYRLESSVSQLQDISMLWPTVENDTSSRPEWYGKPVSILNLYYGERTTTPRVRQKLFETTDLIGSIGGLLGLCLGFSGLSAIELIYFCTLRPWFRNGNFTKIVNLIGRVSEKIVNLCGFQWNDRNTFSIKNLDPNKAMKIFSGDETREDTMNTQDFNNQTQYFSNAWSVKTVSSNIKF